MSKKIKRELLKLIVFFLIGYSGYIAMETTFRGYSFVLMGIVGAIAFIAFGRLNSELIGWDFPLIFQMIIGSGIVTILELIVGWYVLKHYSFRMWDYSDLWMNFHGFICPLFSFLWFLLSGVCIILDDAINYYVFHEDPQPYYKSITGKVLFKLPTRKCE